MTDPPLTSQQIEGWRERTITLLCGVIRGIYRFGGVSNEVDQIASYAQVGRAYLNWRRLNDQFQNSPARPGMEDAGEMNDLVQAFLELDQLYLKVRDGRTTELPNN